jgi:hypothetical protein
VTLDDRLDHREAEPAASRTGSANDFARGAAADAADGSEIVATREGPDETMLLHRGPLRRVLVVCYGVGVTAAAATDVPSIELLMA